MATAVPADPWSSAFMAAGSVAGKALDDKTNMNSALNWDARFDNSGWNVNVGPGATQSTQTDRSSSALGTSQALRNPLVLIALAVAVYLLVVKK